MEKDKCLFSCFVVVVTTYVERCAKYTVGWKSIDNCMCCKNSYNLPNTVYAKHHTYRHQRRTLLNRTSSLSAAMLRSFLFVTHFQKCSQSLSPFSFPRPGCALFPGAPFLNRTSSLSAAMLRSFLFVTHFQKCSQSVSLSSSCFGASCTAFFSLAAFWN